MKTFPKRFTFLLFVFLISSCVDQETTPSIDYGERGLYGPNILYVASLQYASRENSLQCRIPSGHLVTIKITAKQFTEIGLIPNGVWYYEPASLSNWTATDFDDATHSQTFLSSASGVTADGKIMFDEGTFQIDYFENGSLVPTMTKTVEVDY